MNDELSLESAFSLYSNIIQVFLPFKIQRNFNSNKKSIPNPEYIACLFPSSQLKKNEGGKLKISATFQRLERP